MLHIQIGYQVMVKKTGQSGIVIQESNRNPTIHKGLRKPRHEPTKIHFLVQHEDNTRTWYSKYELEILKCMSYEERTK